MMHEQVCRHPQPPFGESRHPNGPIYSSGGGIGDSARATVLTSTDDNHSRGTTCGKG